MKKTSAVSRRSFLVRVTGGGLALGVGLALGAGEARARRSRQPVRMAVDADPRDPARAIPQPVAPAQQARPARTGFTDADSGPNADPQGGGHGRSARPLGPVGRFVICPGNARCPGRNR